MEQLQNEMMNKRSIGKSTAQLYVRNLRILKGKVFNDEEPFDGNLDWLKQTKKIMDYLNTEKTNTRKTRLSSIVVALKTRDIMDDVTFYSDEMYKAINEHNEFIKQNKKSTVQEDNWVTLEDLSNLWNKYKKEVYANDLHKKNTLIINKLQKALLQKWLVTSLYVLTPPRRNRDYSTMTTIDYDQYEDLDKKQKNANNYLVFKKNNDMFFSIGDYKTNNYKEGSRMKNRGVDIQKIPAKLKRVIKIWRKFNSEPGASLILNNRGQQMNANALTKYLMRIFEGTGKKKVSSTILRHVFISECPKLKKYRKNKEDAEQIANSMCHSLSEQQKYYKKDNS